MKVQVLVALFVASFMLTDQTVYGLITYNLPPTNNFIEALNAFNFNTASAYVITLQAGTYSGFLGTFDLGEGSATSITITGAGIDETVLVVGGVPDSVFTCGVACVGVIESLTVTDIFGVLVSADNGGNVIVTSVLVTECSVPQNLNSYVYSVVDRPAIFVAHGDGTTVDIQNSEFSHCQLDVGVVTLQESADGTISDCDFMDIHSLSGGVISLVNDGSYVEMTNINVWNTSAEVGGFLFMRDHPDALLTNINAEETHADIDGGFLYVSRGAIVTLSNFDISKSDAYNGGAFFADQYGAVEATDGSVSNCSGVTSSVVYGFYFASITLTNVDLSDLVGDVSFHYQNAAVSFTNVWINDVFGRISFVRYIGTLRMTDVFISNAYYGAVFSSEGAVVSMDNVNARGTMAAFAHLLDSEFELFDCSSGPLIGDGATLIVVGGEGFTQTVALSVPCVEGPVLDCQGACPSSLELTIDIGCVDGQFPLCANGTSHDFCEENFPPCVGTCVVPPFPSTIGDDTSSDSSPPSDPSEDMTTVIMNGTFDDSHAAALQPAVVLLLGAVLMASL